MVVPQVRAAVFRIFNIGAITIFEIDESEQEVDSSTQINATKPVLTPLVPQEFASEVSMAEVQELLAPSSIYLPTDSQVFS